MKLLVRVLFLSLLQSLMACAQGNFEQKLKLLYKNTVPTLSVSEFDSLQQREDVRLLDTRTKEEHEVSHIKGAEFINYETFDVSEFEQADKEKPIVLYCAVGYRSERVGEALLDKGYKNVYNLYGGIFHWKNEGKPVYNVEGEKTDKVHAYNRIWGIWLDGDKATKVYE